MISLDITFEETKSCKHEILLPDKEKSLEICLQAQENSKEFSEFASKLNQFVNKGYHLNKHRIRLI